MTTKTARASAVTLYGDQPARNCHFRLSADVLDAAEPKAAEEGFSLADVIRNALIDYGSGAKAKAKASSGPPAPMVAGVRKVFASGSKSLINGYMAALARAGWSRQLMADAAVAAGVAESMTRQAVSLRAVAGEEAAAENGGLPEGLPAVPHPGLRRQYPIAKSSTPLPQRDGREISARVLDTDYLRAMARAKAEHAKLAAVVDDYVKRYIADEFVLEGVSARKVGARLRNANAAPAKKATAKKTAAKAAAKKAPAAKAATKEVAAKTSAKKAPATKAPAKKAATKKTATKKAPAKKVATKAAAKTAPKKVSAKAPAKKVAAKRARKA